jgi:hypothetical protein
MPTFFTDDYRFCFDGGPKSGGKPPHSKGNAANLTGARAEHRMWKIEQGFKRKFRIQNKRSRWFAAFYVIA